ncbi:hypothetical protein N9R04_01110 [Staphylococcus sp. SQ8-PEA]|uniref:Uncharacterized protein n=1 Tax=Staphylococcus marylandisciuri TaxID=2981529 RepID=A0ABT2QMW5_9STAP|nr:hypothetical protein [Staphylococcus marylandisciuri]MCU5745319.1 hypothetical protein [Staphylococcus marylandisciuri]
MKVILIGESNRYTQVVTAILQRGLSPRSIVQHLTPRDVNVFDKHSIEGLISRKDIVIYAEAQSTLPKGLKQGRSNLMHGLAIQLLQQCARCVYVIRGMRAQSYFKYLKLLRLPFTPLLLSQSLLESSSTAHSVQEFDSMNHSYITAYLQYYAQYLQYITLGLVRVKLDSEQYDITLLKLASLIKMTINDMSNKAVRLSIVDGCLVKKGVESAGHFIFKVTEDSDNKVTLLTALVNFKPQLPWWVYRLTQAPLHAMVMYGFQFYLRKKQAKSR